MRYLKIESMVDDDLFAYITSLREVGVTDTKLFEFIKIWTFNEMVKNLPDSCEAMDRIWDLKSEILKSLTNEPIVKINIDKN